MKSLHIQRFLLFKFSINKLNKIKPYYLKTSSMFCHFYDVKKIFKF